MKTLLETFFRIFTALKAHGTRSRSHGPHRQIPSSQRITNDGIHSSLHRRHGRLQRLCRLHHRRATDQRGTLLHYYFMFCLDKDTPLIWQWFSWLHILLSNYKIIMVGKYIFSLFISLGRIFDDHPKRIQSLKWSPPLFQPPPHPLLSHDIHAEHAMPYEESQVPTRISYKVVVVIDDILKEKNLSL